MKQLSMIDLFCKATTRGMKGGKQYRWLISITFLGLFFSGLLIFSTRGYVKNEPLIKPVQNIESSEASIPHESVEASPIVTPQQSADIMNAVTLTLKRQGFYPQAITRAANQPFVLVVANRTGLDAITLNLDQPGVTRLNSANVSLGKPDWFKVFNLPKGNYTLSEDGHPEWTCTIIID